MWGNWYDWNNAGTPKSVVEFYSRLSDTLCFSYIKFDNEFGGPSVVPVVSVSSHLGLSSVLSIFSHYFRHQTGTQELNVDFYSESIVFWWKWIKFDREGILSSGMMCLGALYDQKSIAVVFWMFRDGLGVVSQILCYQFFQIRFQE